MNVSDLQNLRVRFLAIPLLVLIAGGCGGAKDPFERTDVSGTVTLDGQPIQFGEIYFKGPVDENDQTAQAFLPIREGKFESVGAQHPTPGENTVTVTIYETDPDVESEDGSPARAIGAWTGSQTVGEEPISINIEKSQLEKAQ